MRVNEQDDARPRALTPAGPAFTPTTVASGRIEELERHIRDAWCRTISRQGCITPTLLRDVADYTHELKRHGATPERVVIRLKSLEPVAPRRTDDIDARQVSNLLDYVIHYSIRAYFGGHCPSSCRCKPRLDERQDRAANEHRPIPLYDETGGGIRQASLDFHLDPPESATHVRAGAAGWNAGRPVAFRSMLSDFTERPMPGPPDRG
jgi:hypothetical protein